MVLPRTAGTSSVEPMPYSSSSRRYEAPKVFEEEGIGHHGQHRGQSPLRSFPDDVLIGAGFSTSSTSRVGRLLRERELRKNNGFLNESHAEDRVYPFEALESSGIVPGTKEVTATKVDSSSTSRNVGGQGRRERQRLLVVANRLPVSATRKGENSWALELSAGGLVSALLGVKQFETKWIGWPGVNVEDEKGQQSLSKALGEKDFIPVFLDEDTADQYYNGYCNNVLWPLFHYIGLQQEDRLAATHSLHSQYKAYKRANTLFSEAVCSLYQDGDIIWCHDYHLMFLPKFLKEHDSHTPFPYFEIYRTLPLCSELLHAVLSTTSATLLLEFFK